MNHTPLDIIKTKQLRGNMIEALYRYYGEDISLSVLKASMPLAGFKQDQLHGFPDLADTKGCEPCGRRSAGCRSGD